jgi:hypothetical protein
LFSSDFQRAARITVFPVIVNVPEYPLPSDWYQFVMNSLFTGRISVEFENALAVPEIRPAN